MYYYADLNVLTNQGVTGYFSSELIVSLNIDNSSLCYFVIESALFYAMFISNFVILGLLNVLTHKL